MALVTRDFDPSVTKTSKVKRRKHIMIAGGREGPEVAGKKPRTGRYVEGGSSSWTTELSSGKTPVDARTQPPFLRSVVGDYRAYARGLMTVRESIQRLERVMEYAAATPGYDPLIEFTGVTVDGRLASFSGRLLEPMVNTLAQSSSQNWPETLRKLADELRAIEAAVPRLPPRVSSTSFAFVPRVYLNMTTSAGDEVSVPVEQMSVVTPQSSSGSLTRPEVVGVYSPGPEDGPLRLKGKVLKIGEPIKLDAFAVEYVTVDPPQFGEAAFMETPAFARSRGFLIELSQYEMGRTGSTEQRFIVPYDRVLRVRMIYPPASGYTRTSSKAIENVETVRRELDAANRHINAMREELAYKTLSRISSPNRRFVTITDEVSGFRFGLQDPSFEGATNPVIVWLPFEVRNDKKEPIFIPPQGEYSLMGRPVTAIDYLRLLRAARPDRGLRELRRFRFRGSS